MLISIWEQKCVFLGAHLFVSFWVWFWSIENGDSKYGFVNLYLSNLYVVFNFPNDLSSTVAGDEIPIALHWYRWTLLHFCSIHQSVIFLLLLLFFINTFNFLFHFFFLSESSKTLFWWCSALVCLFSRVLEAGISVLSLFLFRFLSVSLSVCLCSHTSFYAFLKFAKTLT